MVNDAGKKEINALGSFLVTDKLSSLVLAHVEDNSKVDDHQKDGFLDHPFIRQYNLLNRWFYTALTRAQKEVFLVGFQEKLIVEEERNLF